MYLCCQAVLPYMIEQGRGSIINTASFVAVMGSATSQISYTASKGGVLAMSRELGVQFARQGVRVNALCPGPVNTPLLQELFADDPERAARRLVHMPMGRFAEAERDRQRRTLSRLRRVELHHRVAVPGGRRDLRRVRHAAGLSPGGPSGRRAQEHADRGSPRHPAGRPPVGPLLRGAVVVPGVLVDECPEFTISRSAHRRALAAPLPSVSVSSRDAPTAGRPP